MEGDLNLPKIVDSAKGMKNLVGEMLSGILDTQTMIALLKLHSPGRLSATQLSGCVEGIVGTATYQLNTRDFLKPVVVPVGTGGDRKRIGKPTVNITTMAGIVMAAEGSVDVALYGNQAASGLLGKMDLLGRLGVPIDLMGEQVQKNIKNRGIAPLFAKNIYPGARFVAEARKSIPEATLFNFAFPLAAPVVGDPRILLGVSKEEMVPRMAEIAVARGIRQGIVVHDAINGLDEAYPGMNRIAEIRDGQIVKQTIDLAQAARIDMRTFQLQHLQEASADRLVDLFGESIDPNVIGSRLDSIRKIVALNAALGIYVAKGKGDLMSELPDLYQSAIEILQSGKALKKLQEMQRK